MIWKRSLNNRLCLRFEIDPRIQLISELVVLCQIIGYIVKLFFNLYCSMLVSCMTPIALEVHFESRAKICHFGR